METLDGPNPARRRAAPLWKGSADRQSTSSSWPIRRDLTRNRWPHRPFGRRTSMRGRKRSRRLCAGGIAVAKNGGAGDRNAYHKEEFWLQPKYGYAVVKHVTLTVPRLMKMRCGRA